MTVAEKDVKFYLYTKNVDGIPFNKQNVSVLNFDSSKNTVFVVHGWMNNVDSVMCQSVKDAYLEVKDVNVIIVDWSVVSQRQYVTAKFFVTRIGKVIAGLIQFMSDNVGLKMENTSMVGHSLGAHVCGVASRNVNSTLDHLTGKCSNNFIKNFSKWLKPTQLLFI